LEPKPIAITMAQTPSSRCPARISISFAWSEWLRKEKMLMGGEQGVAATGVYIGAED
jgi:hypothetical protein